MAIGYGGLTLDPIGIVFNVLSTDVNFTQR